MRLREGDDKRDLAVDLGLISTSASVRLGRVLVTVPPWLHPASRPLPPGVVAATLGSIGHNAAGMSLLLFVAGGASAAGRAMGSIEFSGLGDAMLVVLFSVLVHEVGHVVAYRLLMPRDAPGVLVVRGMSCHLVRVTAGRRRDVVITLAGAGAPIVVAASLVLLHPADPFVVTFAVMVAVAHVALLVIPVGDGASLRGSTPLTPERPMKR